MDIQDLRDISPTRDGSRLLATATLGGTLLHVDAIAVHDIDGTQEAVSAEWAGDLDLAYELSGGDGPFATATFDGFGHDYVVVALPYHD